MPSETATPTPPRQVGDRVARRRVIRNAVIAFVAGCIVLLVSYLVPVPTVASVRSWGQDLGPGFVWVFFLAYALLTVFPIPRTVFTVSAGVLFGQSWVLPVHWSRRRWPPRSDFSSRGGQGVTGSRRSYAVRSS